ncbi:MAG TPA: GyrI-like domain-containing protein [Bacillales bacterium]|nr:GyrI-like domain-containing protein [Bacillales bacterium]
MDVKIKERPAFHIVGLSCDIVLKDARQTDTIPKLHEAFSKRVDEIRNRINPNLSYGLFIDPLNYNPDTDPFTWVAGVEVSDLEEIPEGMVGQTFNAPHFAVFSYKGKDKSSKPYDMLYKWVDQSADYQLADRFGMEVYDERYHGPLDPDSTFDLWFPVAKKQI